MPPKKTLAPAEPIQATPVIAPLWKLNEELEAIFALIEEADGELTPELETRLDQANLDFNVKAESCGLRKKAFDYEAELLAKEEKRIQQLRRRKERAAAGLDRYLQRELLRAQKSRAGGLRMEVTLVQNSQPSIKWVGPPETIPEDWRKTPPPPPAPAIDYDKVVTMWRDPERRAEIEQTTDLLIEVGHHVRY